MAPFPATKNAHFSKYATVHSAGGRGMWPANAPRPPVGPAWYRQRCRRWRERGTTTWKSCTHRWNAWRNFRAKTDRLESAGVAASTAFVVRPRTAAAVQLSFKLKCANINRQIPFSIQKPRSLNHLSNEYTHIGDGVLHNLCVKKGIANNDVNLAHAGGHSAASSSGPENSFINLRTMFSEHKYANRPETYVIYVGSEIWELLYWLEIMVAVGEVVSSTSTGDTLRLTMRTI